jgi:hypothetical protein
MPLDPGSPLRAQGPAKTAGIRVAAFDKIGRGKWIIFAAKDTTNLRRIIGIPVIPTEMANGETCVQVIRYLAEGLRSGFTTFTIHS